MEQHRTQAFPDGKHPALKTRVSHALSTTCTNSGMRQGSLREMSRSTFSGTKVGLST